MQNNDRERFKEALERQNFSYNDKFKGSLKSNKNRKIKEKKIDLHGFTSAKANDILETVLKSSRNTCVTHIKIVCGRGLHSENGPVLRGVVETLLLKMKDYYEKYDVDLNNNFTVVMKQK